MTRDVFWIGFSQLQEFKGQNHPSMSLRPLGTADDWVSDVPRAMIRCLEEGTPKLVIFHV